MIRTKTMSLQSTPLELTPLIDIVFIVIVFLLLTTNAPLLSLPVEIPSSDSPAKIRQAPPKTLVISLQSSAPFWAIDKQTFNNWQDFKPALLTQLERINQEQKIHIAPARNANVEPLIKLLALLNAQQITNTQILMKEQKP